MTRQQADKQGQRLNERGHSFRLRHNGPDGYVIVLSTGQTFKTLREVDEFLRKVRSAK